MSEQPGVPDPEPQAETGLLAGVAGPSGTGEQTDAGADPAADLETTTGPEADQ